MQTQEKLEELINYELDSAIEFVSNPPKWYTKSEARRWYNIIEGELCVLVAVYDGVIEDAIASKLNKLAELIGE